VEQQEHLQFTDQTADDRAHGDQLPFILFERRTAGRRMPSNSIGVSCRILPMIVLRTSSAPVA
jgi:hypothetical protein